MTCSTDASAVHLEIQGTRTLPPTTPRRDIPGEQVVVKAYIATNLGGEYNLYRG